MMSFLSANWLWIVFIGAMLLMHLGHRGHMRHGGSGGACGPGGGCGASHGGAQHTVGRHEHGEPEPASRDGAARRIGVTADPAHPYRDR